MNKIVLKEKLDFLKYLTCLKKLHHQKDRLFSGKKTVKKFHTKNIFRLQFQPIKKPTFLFS